METKKFTKIMVIGSMFILLFQGVNAQMIIAESGKVGFKTDIPEWGTIEINKDGKHDGICIYEPANSGVTFRMFRDNDYGYLTRGGDFDRGIRISPNGRTEVFCKADYTDIAFTSNVLSTKIIGLAVKSNDDLSFIVYGSGVTYGTEFNVSSDINLKENINKIDGALAQVMKLNGVSYNFKEKVVKEIKSNDIDDSEKQEPGSMNNTEEKIDPKLQKQIKENANKRSLGLIAQEIEMVYPELVSLDANGNKAVNYIGLIPVLIEALKEQQQQILKQEEYFSALKSSTSNNSVTETASIEKGSALLKQNRPNPFNEQTTIEFYLPETVSKAMLNIFDLTGKQVRSFNVVQRHEGEVTVFANELQPGMYKYALIADGTIVDTRSMIITD